MSFTSINFAPPIGTAGTRVKMAVLGAASALRTDRLNPAKYAYLQSAPSGSKLKTLDQLAELQTFLAGTTAFYEGTLPLSTERKELRLEIDPGGFLYFTPDVPGDYAIRVYDVTEYRFVPHWQGNVPAAGEVAELDNETGALPAYAGGTAQAPSLLVTYHVAETRSRAFGVAPDIATLKIRTYSATVDDTADQHGVSLVPANTLVARRAASARDVQRVLTAFRRQTTDLAKETVMPWANLPDGSTPIPQLVTYVVAAWNEHIANQSSWGVHGAADSTNAVTSPSATDLASALVLLNELRGDYEAHRVLTAGAVHVGADAINALSAPAATDLVTGLALWADIRAKLWEHGTRATVHSATTGKPVDGAMREWSEPPLTEAELAASANEIVTLYENHRVLTSQAAPHAAADSDNIVTTIGADTTTIAGLCQLVNTLANAIENHAANRKPDLSAPVSAYHTKADPSLKIPTRAVDATSLSITLEYVLVRMTDHFANTGSHGTKVLGRHGFARWPLAARLTRAWDRSVAPTIPATPSGWNASASWLASYGWS